MAFTLSAVIVDGQELVMFGSPVHEANNITLITGANGTGKTRMLSGLASQFSGRRSWRDSSVRGNTNARSLDEPARVVAQTFSPFSRFPAERARALSLEEYLQPQIEKYVAIGFTRSSNLRGSVSKEAISRIARKIFTQPEQAAPLGNALRSLGFEPNFRIEYHRSPVAPSLDLGELDSTILYVAIEAFLADLASKSKKSSEEIRMAREIESQPRIALAQKLFDSIRAVQQSLSPPLGLRGRRVITIELSLRDNVLVQREELEGAITLARLGLLRVSDCVLRIIPGGRWRRETQSALTKNELSIMDASSGEQQLLSSLFGLVAEMQDDALVLIDEPELSLHPSWQTQFLDLLRAVILPFKGCHVLVATHSALLAQRGQELGIPVLSLDEDRRSIPPADAPPSVEQTLVNVFELPVRDSTYVGRLLLSLVMAAEKDPVAASTARIRLEKLKRLYEQAIIPDDRTLGLIHDALALIEQGPQDQVDEEEDTPWPRG